MYRVVRVIAFLIAPVMSFGNAPAMCLADPPLQLQAGISEVSITVERAVSDPCRASLIFDDLSLPLIFNFPSADCAGTELLSFYIPRASTSGNATITWQCSGQVSSCSRALVFGGLADQNIELDREGQVACILETLQTSTTVITATEASTTVLKTLMSLVTVTSTSSLDEPIKTQTTISAPRMSLNYSRIPTATTTWAGYAGETIRRSPLRPSNDSLITAASGSTGSSGPALSLATAQPTAITPLLPVTAGSHILKPGAITMILLPWLLSAIVL